MVGAVFYVIGTSRGHGLQAASGASSFVVWGRVLPTTRAAYVLGSLSGLLRRCAACRGKKDGRVTLCKLLPSAGAPAAPPPAASQRRLRRNGPDRRIHRPLPLHHPLLSVAICGSSLWLLAAGLPHQGLSWRHVPSFAPSSVAGGGVPRHLGAPRPAPRGVHSCGEALQGLWRGGAARGAPRHARPEAG